MSSPLDYFTPTMNLGAKAMGRKVDPVKLGLLYQFMAMCQENPPLAVFTGTVGACVGFVVGFLFMGILWLIFK